MMLPEISVFPFQSK